MEEEKISNGVWRSSEKAVLKLQENVGPINIYLNLILPLFRDIKADLGILTPKIFHLFLLLRVKIQSYALVFWSA